jgi:predicted SAM-dependent methyltransferase
MRRTLNNVVKEGMFGEPAVALYHSLYRLRRKTSRNDRKVIEQYFAQHPVKKLQLGCGENVLEGWLNSDYYPKASDVIHLDATAAYPFQDRTFDYVFSEHMIEHIPYPHGHSMLKESWRVLKDGGKIRISTPDLAFLIALYRPEKTPLQEEYIRKSSKDCGAALACDTFVINNFVRAWRHTFIYDEKVLRFSLEQAGFVDIVRLPLNESGEAAFQNLENERRSPEGFLKLESLTLEGTRKTV